MGGGSCVGRNNIYDVWLTHNDGEGWRNSTLSVGEHWKYGRFVAMKGIGPLRVEVWYDSRTWMPKLQLDESS